MRRRPRPPAAMPGPERAHVRTPRTRPRTLGDTMPACHGHGETAWAPSWSLLWDWGTAPRQPGDVPASPRAWRCPGILTFRSAGNSSFFTSPVAAAMLPAPVNAASPSWDACSFAFSATARARSAHQCPPHAKRGAQLWFHDLHHTGGSWWGDTGQDQALPNSLPWWGGEGAVTLLCSWARSVSSRRKSLVAGPVT